MHKAGRIVRPFSLGTYQVHDSFPVVFELSETTGDESNPMNVRPKYPGPGLDTKIPKSGLKIYPKILQKMSKNPNFISKNLEMYSINPLFLFGDNKIICIKCGILVTCTI